METKTAGTPADVYALGVVLYEAFTGALPFEDATSVALVLAKYAEPSELRIERDATGSSGVDRAAETAVRTR